MGPHKKKVSLHAIILSRHVYKYTHRVYIEFHLIYLSIEAEYDFIGPEVCSKTDTQFKVCASYDVARTISNFETLLLCFSRAQTF